MLRSRRIAREIASFLATTLSGTQLTMIDFAARAHVYIDLTMSGVVICAVKDGLHKIPSFVSRACVVKHIVKSKEQRREGNGAPLFLNYERVLSTLTFT